MTGSASILLIIVLRFNHSITPPPPLLAVLNNRKYRSYSGLSQFVLSAGSQSKKYRLCLRHVKAANSHHFDGFVFRVYNFTMCSQPELISKFVFHNQKSELFCSHLNQGVTCSHNELAFCQTTINSSDCLILCHKNQIFQWSLMHQ